MICKYKILHVFFSIIYTKMPENAEGNEDFQKQLQKMLILKSQGFHNAPFILWKIKQVFENVDGKNSSLTVFSSVFSCILV